MKLKVSQGHRFSRTDKKIPESWTSNSAHADERVESRRMREKHHRFYLFRTVEVHSILYKYGKNNKKPQNASLNTTFNQLVAPTCAMIA